MANNIPVKFKHMAFAFNEASRPSSDASSGSEHLSLDDLTDLSDLVNSFIERSQSYGLSNNNNSDETKEGDNEISTPLEEEEEEEGEKYYWSYLERKEMLESLLNGCDNCDIRQMIRADVELIAMSSSLTSIEFKRHLMARLRERGFDAGLSKSRWEKFGRHPSGSYDYIDVNHNGVRYIVEVFLSREFEIARPTVNYISLLNLFPNVLVATHEEMKQLTKIMCASIRESMKIMNLHLPPWRRNGYTQAKWFGPYKRTTRELSAESSSNYAANLSIGFKVFPVKSYRCGDNFGRQPQRVVGQLTAALRGKQIGVGL